MEIWKSSRINLIFCLFVQEQKPRIILVSHELPLHLIKEGSLWRVDSTIEIFENQSTQNLVTTQSSNDCLWCGLAPAEVDQLEQTGEMY